MNPLIDQRLDAGDAGVVSDQQKPAIEAGMNPDEAIAAMMKQCESRWFTQCNAASLIQWLFAQSGVPNIASFDEETRQAQLTQLRKHLSSPVTAHEAAALSGIGFGTYSVDHAVRRIRRQSGSPQDDRGALDLDSLPPVDGQPEQGYWLDFRKAKDSEHWFGGECPIPAAPCINCEKPLLHFLSFDTHDPRVELSGFPHRHLPLLFCWTCQPESEFTYRIEQSGVRIIDMPLGERLDDFPYPDYPQFFPRRRVGLKAIPAKQQGLIRHLMNDEFDLPERYQHLNEAKHQIGGQAFLWQPPPCEGFQCPVCTDAMPFFATICDNAEGPNVTKEYRLGFTNNSCVQVVYHLCRRCCIVGAYQICD